MRDELLQRGAQISDVLEDGLHVRTGVIRVRTEKVRRVEANVKEALLKR
jgi:hypothetical protein